MSSLQLFLINSYDFESDTYISYLGILIIGTRFYLRSRSLIRPCAQFSMVPLQSRHKSEVECDRVPRRANVMRLSTRGFRVIAALLKPHLDLTTLH